MDVSTHSNAAAAFYSANSPNAVGQNATRRNEANASAAIAAQPLKRANPVSDTQLYDASARVNEGRSVRPAREIEVEATELRPFVINNELPKSTRPFLEVSAERNSFHLIDIYV